MRLLVFLWALSASYAEAAPLTNAQTYGAQHPDAFRNGTPGMIMVKGTTDNNSYMLEADPTTGAIPVDATVTFNYDTNYGTPGADTLRTAAMLGVGSTAVSNSNPVPISDAGGSITVDGTVAATQSGTWSTGRTWNLGLSDSVNAVQSGTWTVQPGNTANTTAWLVKQNGNSYADSIRNVYSSTNVTTGAWVQLIAATAATINCITIFDSGGQTMELGTGASSSETRVLIIPPGGISGCVPLRITSGTRVSIRAISATANTGELDVTGLQ